DDILIGSPIAGRFHTDIQNIVGMFVNMLVHRNFPSKDKTFRHYLAEVKENALNAFDNQDYQFDQLVSKLELQRTSDRNMLVESVFTLQNATAPTGSDGSDDSDGGGREDTGLDIKIYPHEINSSKFDLSLDTVEHENTISMYFTYATALFKKSTIEKMKRYYIEILEQVVENTGIKIGEISISLDKEAVVSTVDGDDDLDFVL
ncbi:MAG: hypothetical protein GY757_37285, partial [bacterium]|nr:hypothetical protein [bacterium]